jgi:hypothetical protein
MNFSHKLTSLSSSCWPPSRIRAIAESNVRALTLHVTTTTATIPFKGRKSSYSQSCSLIRVQELNKTLQVCNQQAKRYNERLPINAFGTEWPIPSGESASSINHELDFDSLNSERMYEANKAERAANMHLCAEMENSPDTREMSHKGVGSQPSSTSSGPSVFRNAGNELTKSCAGTHKR